MGTLKVQQVMRSSLFRFNFLWAKEIKVVESSTRLELF
jgi:hypothetical protein